MMRAAIATGLCLLCLSAGAQTVSQSPAQSVPAVLQGYGDTKRLTCNVTTTATQTGATIAAPCSFSAADVGKIIVVNNAGASAITPLVSTIAAVAGANSITLGNAAGQSLVTAAQPVTWGHDDSAAIQACFSSAPGCTVPQAPGGYWGSAATLELYPAATNATVRGIGRDRSQIIALALLSSLVHRNGGYRAGGSLSDMSFDGNKLATDVGYLQCATLRHDRNVGFYNAATDADLVYGDSTGASQNCNSNQVYALDVENNLAALYPTNDYPVSNLIVGGTDSMFYSVFAAFATTKNVVLSAAPAAANNTSIHGLHVFNGTTFSIASIAVSINSLVQRIYDLICDNGVDTCVDIVAGGDVGIYGGFFESSTNPTNGIRVATGLPDIVIQGMDLTTVATAGNRIIFTGSMGNNVHVTGNPGAADQIGTTNVLLNGAALFRLTSVIVANLPGCIANNKNFLAVATDANAPTFGSTVAGGGGANVVVICDGTNWVVR
jgi:hypothetical protein